jgi:hypothetical protein
VVNVARPNHDVAPDRAAILVSRDTTPLQAARQVNAIVSPKDVRPDMPKMPTWKPPKNIAKALEDGDGSWEDERW